MGSRQLTRKSAGKSTGQSADTDTVVASAKAYVNALNRLLVRRDKVGKDVKEISYKDVS